MLEDCLLESRSSARSKNPVSLAVSVFTHAVIGGVLILVPLFTGQVLPQIPPPEPLPPPMIRMSAVDLVPTPRQGGPKKRHDTGGPVSPPTTSLIAPLAIPKTIVSEIDDSATALAGFTPGGIFEGGAPFGVPGLSGGETGGTRVAAPPPPPPSPPPAPPKPAVAEPVVQAPVAKGGLVMMSALVHQVTPTYPQLARITRVQGAVILEAVITREGLIDSTRLRVVSGNTLLNQGAIDAVKQWRYKPTLLNGQPVEVLTTITVNFTLN